MIGLRARESVSQRCLAVSAVARHDVTSAARNKASIVHCYRIRLAVLFVLYTIASSVGKARQTARRVPGVGMPR